METFDIDQVNKLIKNRRSIYPSLYTGEVIDDTIIENILENANWAPNHAKTEPWRFTVFTGAGLQKLAKFQSDMYKKTAETNESYDESKFQKLATKPLLASHIISIGMKRCEKENIPEIEEIEAVACAVQNMYLTATAHNVGCYWGSGGVTYIDEAKAFFDLGPKDKLLGFLYLGVPKKWPEGTRNPIENKVTWVDK